MKNKNTCVFFLCMMSSYTYSFQYDKATYAAQKGEWQQAQEQLNALLVDNHNRSDMLYDAGIAAAHLEQHDKALAYFCQAAQSASDAHLKKQALFNAGNAAVAAKRLPEALEKFEAVLALDKDDEYARHNRDKVREMLQKQQEQQQQQQNQQDQQKQDQQDQENSSDQQKKDQQQNNNQDNKSDQKKDGQSGSNGDDGQDKDQNQQGSKKQSDDKKSGDSADNGNGSDRKNEGNKQEQREQPEQNEQRNGEQKSENKADHKQDERDGQQQENHNQTPQKDINQDTTVPSNQDKEQEQSQGNNAGNAAHQGQEEMEQAFASKMNNPLLARILEQQETKDKAMNKQLMEAKMRQNGGGNDAYNNW